MKGREGKGRKGFLEIEILERGRGGRGGTVEPRCCFWFWEEMGFLF